MKSKYNIQFSRLRDIYAWMNGYWENFHIFSPIEFRGLLKNKIKKTKKLFS